MENLDKFKEILASSRLGDEFWLLKTEKHENRPDVKTRSFPLIVFIKS